MHQWEKGGAWNYLSYPTIYGEFSYFLAWWSPGQWMLTYFLKIIFGENIQFIHFILIFSFTTLGLIGYFKVFKQFQFSSQITFLSLFLIVTNQLFYWHFILFYGGDLFVFCALPYFVLFLINVRTSITIKNLLLFTALSLLGIFLKNTFLIFVGFGLFYIYFSNFKFLESKIKSLFYITITGTSIILYAYHFFLSKGETPGSAIDIIGYENVKNDLFGDLFYALGSPIGIFTKITPILQKSSVFFNKFNINVNIFQGFMTLLTILFVFYIRKSSLQKYAVFLIYFVLPILVLFMIFHIQNKAISYEMRHFAPLAYFFFPGILFWVFNLKKYKKPLIYCLIFLAFLDLSIFFIKKNDFQKSHNAFKGHYFYNEESELLNFVNQIDQKKDSTLFISQNVWFPIFGIEKNDKICLLNVNDSLFVFPGMEINNMPEFSFNKLDNTKYKNVYYLTRKNQTVKLKNPSSVYESENYSVFRVYFE
jgi:hypothetical protein